MSSNRIHPAPPLSATVRRPGYATLALQAIDDLHSISDPFDLLSQWQQACRALGVDAASYVHGVPEGEDRIHLHVMLFGATDPDRPLLPEPAAIDRGWLRRARHHVESVTCSPSICDRATDADISHASDGEIRSILMVPTHGGSVTGHFGLLCLGSFQGGDFDQPSTHVVHLLARCMAAELHAWWLRTSRAQLMAASRLRATDLKLLALEHDGLSTKQISRLLGLSASSIDSRFQRINLRLNCPNRRAAARRVAHHGLLQSAWDGLGLVRNTVAADR